MCGFPNHDRSEFSYKLLAGVFVKLIITHPDSDKKANSKFFLNKKEFFLDKNKFFLDLFSIILRINSTKLDFLGFYFNKSAVFNTVKDVNSEINCESITAFFQSENITLFGKQFEMTLNWK